MKKIALIGLLATSMFADFAIVNSWTSTVRTEANEDSKIVAYAKFGTIFDATTFDDEWLKVKKGYITKKGMILTDNLIDLKLKVIVNGANVRTRPYPLKSTFAKVVKRGEILKAVYKYKNGWYLLEDGKFIYSSTVMPLYEYSKIKEIVTNPVNSKSLNKLNNKSAIELDKDDFDKEIQKSIKHLIVSSIETDNKIESIYKQLKTINKKELDLQRTNLKVLSNDEIRNKLYIAKDSTRIYKDKELKEEISIIRKNRIIEVVADNGEVVQLSIGGYASKKFLQKLGVDLKYLNEVKSKIDNLTHRNRHFFDLLSSKVDKEEVEQIVESKLEKHELGVNQNSEAILRLAKALEKIEKQILIKKD